MRSGYVCIVQCSLSTKTESRGDMGDGEKNRLCGMLWLSLRLAIHALGDDTLQSGCHHIQGIAAKPF